MEKSASQLRMEADLQRMEEERLGRMGIPPYPRFEVIKNRDVDMANPPIVDYKNKINFIFKDDVGMKAKYGNPKLDAEMEAIIKKKLTAITNKTDQFAKNAIEAAIMSTDLTKTFQSVFSPNISHSLWTSNSSNDDDFLSVVDAAEDADLSKSLWTVAEKELGTIPSFKWVTVELPLYVGQQKVSEVMELMEQIHERHGDDDTGSLYKVQDAFDGFVNSHDTHIRAGSDNGVHTSEFTFWVRLPSENYANLLSSWPRDNSSVGSYVTIHVTARVASLFFVGYDFEESVGTPLRVKLHIKCQNGHENRVEQVLSKLLLENGTFYVIGAADLNGSAVETFEISKMGFVDVLAGQEQVLLS